MLTAAEQARRNERTRLGLFVAGSLFILIALALIVWAEGAGATRVVTTGTAPDLTVTTYAGHTARGSDTLDVFLLGVGVVLVLAGAFYSRITKIGLPGGGEIDLAPADSAKLADHVKKAVGPDAQKFEQAYPIALVLAAEHSERQDCQPPDHALEAAADAAKRAVG